MESSDFEAWLSAMRSLTAGQRRLAFLELTLAEAADLSEDGAEESDSAAAPPTIVEAEPGKELASTGAPASTHEREMFGHRQGAFRPGRLSALRLPRGSSVGRRERLASLPMC